MLNTAILLESFKKIEEGLQKWKVEVRELYYLLYF